MMYPLSRTLQGVIALSASLVLIACGGGGGGDTPPAVVLVAGTDVPVTATQSDQAAFDFVASIVAKGEANTDAPLVIGDAVLAASEIAEPAFVAA
jgi:hypothetical protein